MWPSNRLELSGEPPAAVRIPGPGSTRFPVLELASRMLRNGKILAVKGVGGFHLLCDATSARARPQPGERKRRDRKPLAVLFLDMEQVSAFAEADETARQVLLAPMRRLCCSGARRARRSPTRLPPGSSTVGAFLAYTPLHRALVRMVERPLVATSGNPSDEPMPIENDTAHAELGHIADAFLFHNRRILRHADDSVVRIIGGSRCQSGSAADWPRSGSNCRSSRRPSGNWRTSESGVGIHSGPRTLPGQHIGDLDTPSARGRYVANVADLTRLFGVEPTRIVHDAHPDYFTTRYAEERGLPCLAVQHHHAHIMACLAEHGERGPALGIAWDGTGYGDDGTIWGGEFLTVDASELPQVRIALAVPSCGRRPRRPRAPPLGRGYLLRGGRGDSRRAGLLDGRAEPTAARPCDHHGPPW